MSSDGDQMMTLCRGYWKGAGSWDVREPHDQKLNPSGLREVHCVTVIAEAQLAPL